MRLATLSEPFDNPEWIFELKFDGFRALAAVESGRCCLYSRNRHIYKSFSELNKELSQLDFSAVLDGEIVVLDDQGRPLFYDLLRHRSKACFVVFDILSLNGKDLRNLPLMERKRILRSTVATAGRLIVPDHIEARGVEFFREVCKRDLEGIVAKWRHGSYIPGEAQPTDRNLRRQATKPEAAARLTWIKIKNPAYSQAEGRAELFRRLSEAK